MLLEPCRHKEQKKIIPSISTHSIGVEKTILLVIAFTVGGIAEGESIQTSNNGRARIWLRSKLIGHCASLVLVIAFTAGGIAEGESIQIS